VLGGGFAGLWSAAAAARAIDLAGPAARDAVEVTLLNPDPFHVIRVRCYEADLAPVRVPLDEVLGPIGVRRVEATATGLDARRRVVATRAADGREGELAYDRLVLATGSALARPGGDGDTPQGFDVDTYAGALRLQRHLAALGAADAAGMPGRWTAVVIGAGLVGIEVACELRARLHAVRDAAGLPPREDAVRVLLLDHAAEAGGAMGAAAMPSIVAALTAAGVEARGGTAVRSADAAGVTLACGERIPAATTIWATGMRASPLGAALGVACDRLGRLPVDPFLRVRGVEGIYAAGDVACAAADAAGHETVMSCQHARPMGRIAGHNAACDLLGREAERVAFAAQDYVTVLDLGPWGAVYTAGWDRGRVVASGAEAKRVKQEINGRRIYPPPHGERHAILEAAAPVIQRAPAVSP
jgi:NADH dehydrogenase